MTIGHHVGDRAHIIEKRRDSKGKEIREQERFVGIQKGAAYIAERIRSTRTL